MNTQTSRQPAKTCPRCGAPHTSTQPSCPTCTRRYHRRYYYAHQLENHLAEVRALMAQANHALAAAEPALAGLQRRY
jgi:predicted amidophosphoribosyltransferase